MPLNRWIEHIRKFARENNMTYSCALSDPNLKDGYIPSPKRVGKRATAPAVAAREREATTAAAAAATVIPEKWRQLLLRPQGIGSALLLHRALKVAKNNWIRGNADKNGVLYMEELTKKQQMYLDADGDATVRGKGSVLTVKGFEDNKDLINAIMEEIAGTGGGVIDLYHSGGMGQQQAFKIRLRGTAKQKREALAGVENWLEKIPSGQIIEDLYDSEFKEQRANTVATDKATKADTRLAAATAWLGRPLNEFNPKDVVRSWKLLTKQKNFSISGINTILKEAKDNAPELISRLYALTERFSSQKQETQDDFKKSLLSKIYWEANLRNLPADLGMEIASYLNLPKGLTKEIADRRNNTSTTKKTGKGRGSRVPTSEIQRLRSIKRLREARQREFDIGNYNVLVPPLSTINATLDFLGDDDDFEPQPPNPFPPTEQGLYGRGRYRDIDYTRTIPHHKFLEMFNMF